MNIWQKNLQNIFEHFCAKMERSGPGSRRGSFLNLDLLFRSNSRSGSLASLPDLLASPFKKRASSKSPLESSVPAKEEFLVLVATTDPPRKAREDRRSEIDLRFAKFEIDIFGFPAKSAPFI